MKKLRLLTATLASVVLLSACAGTPVALGNRTTASLPAGEVRSISAKACGFQLLLVIPININDRMERAYGLLQGQAGGDFITDVEVKESWTYALVGTSYCTTLQAKVVRRT